MKESQLTGQKLWEDYWEDKKDRKATKKKNLLYTEILRTFDKYLPKTKGLTILEIGGGQGEYLLYLTQRFGYKAHSLDYSRIGNEQTNAIFAKAGIPVELFERDLFSDNSDLPKFDIVFSLGLIEHFDEPGIVVEKHLGLLKSGGLLLLGVPNYGGIYRPVLKLLAPAVEATHNMDTMNLENWRSFEERFTLQPIFTGYIGGFEPMNMKKLEVKNVLTKIIYFFIRVLMVLFSFRMRFLRKFNSKYWSGYLIGIYRKK